MDYKAILIELNHVMSEINNLVLNMKKSNNMKIEEKTKANYVTPFDIAIEEFLRKRLRQILPGSNFIGEESGFSKDKFSNKTYEAYSWVVDPLDGTTNFLHNFPYAISIGLLEGHNQVLAIVLDEKDGIIYQAILGEGAYKLKLNEEKATLIGVNKKSNINGSFICTDFPYGDEKKKVTLQMMEKLLKQGSSIKTIGPVSLDICRVADGSFDASFHTEIRPWDIAAASLILKEAGGQFLKMDGKKLTKEDLLDSNCKLDYIATSSEKLNEDMRNL